MLIGIGISTSATSDSDAVTAAVTAETLGFDFVSASDHPVGSRPSYETATLLTWIAARTNRIAVASRVFGMPFRRPAMLAKAAESLSRLSGGRLILGLGAGHSDDEIAALGGPAMSPREKVDGLADAIAIMRGAWTGTPFSHDGTVHSVRTLEMSPRPDAHIPIWLGTYGPRALAVTGRLADGWIPSLGFAPPARLPDMLDRIRSAAADAGRGPDAVQAVYNVPVLVDRRARSDENTIAGGPADVVEQLRSFTDLGISGFNLMPQRDTDIHALGEEVLPAFRGG
jgi:alkanesulfonate monooxygenase SsuD/methylene tetrahydromethanopterin reductase-like flavin-dependent oxidoreductase (luciferase family)